MQSTDMQSCKADRFLTRNVMPHRKRRRDFVHYGDIKEPHFISLFSTAISEYKGTIYKGRHGNEKRRRNKTHIRLCLNGSFLLATVDSEERRRLYGGF